MRIVLITVLILSAGCFNKTTTLNCSHEQELEGYKTIVEFNSIYDLEGKDILSLDIETKMIGEVANLNKDTINSSCDEYQGVEGISCDVSMDDGSVDMIIKYDFLKISETFLEEDKFVKQTKEEFKKSLEEASFICE